MQSTKVKDKRGLPVLFVPIQIAGVAIIGLGWLALHSGWSASIIVAMPMLAEPLTDWMIVAFGVAVLVVNGACLIKHADKRRALQADLSAPEVGRRDGIPFAGQQKDSESTVLLPPVKNKIIASVFGVIGFLASCGPGCALLLSCSKSNTADFGEAACALFLILAGLGLGLAAISMVTIRVKIEPGFINFDGLFKKRRFATSEIKAVKVNMNRGRNFVAIRTEKSYFLVSDYSFSLDQLDAIKKFCDPQNKMTSTGF